MKIMTLQVNCQS